MAKRLQLNERRRRPMKGQQLNKKGRASYQVAAF